MADKLKPPPSRTWGPDRPRLPPSVAAREARKCPRCGQRLDPRFAACSCVEPNADPIPARAWRENVPPSQWTDAEVCAYTAFVFESAAHLAGGFGALTPANCIALAARLRRVGGGS